MENNPNADLDRWVSERMSALAPGSEFRPNASWAFSRFLCLRATRIRKGRVWGWTAIAACIALLCLLAIPNSRVVAQRWLNFNAAASLPEVAATDQPEYAGAQLVRPTGYRGWIYLSSGLGMEYSAVADGSENFTNVFVPQWAYQKFLATGKWPDKVMFVLESRSSQTSSSISKSGHFQSDLSGLAVEVKDESRFADKWAYFNFKNNAMTAEAMTGPADACWQCHDHNAAVENTFVQFYPTLKPVALKFGTFRAQAE